MRECSRIAVILKQKTACPYIIASLVIAGVRIRRCLEQLSKGIVCPNRLKLTSFVSFVSEFVVWGRNTLRQNGRIQIVSKIREIAKMIFFCRAVQEGFLYIRIPDMRGKGVGKRYDGNTAVE